MLKDDFTYEELEWLDVVMNRLTPSLSKGEGEAKRNEIHGSFTRDEINKTLGMILQPAPSLGEGVGGWATEDFMKCTEGTAVKIIADFFLQKALQGSIIKSFSMN